SRHGERIALARRAMKAIAVTPKSHALGIVELAPPALARPGDVLVRILDVGVCGTDREICAFEDGTPPAGSEALVIGHEAPARVEAVGESVTRVRPGDLVVPMVRRPCGRPECRACREDRQDFCYTGEYTERGIQSRNGYMTELVVDDEKYFVPVPPALREIG